MLVAVRLHDHVDLEWLRPGPGRFVEVLDAPPPADLSRRRRTVTPCEASGLVELDLAEPVVCDVDALEDELAAWLAG